MNPAVAFNELRFSSVYRAAPTATVNCGKSGTCTLSPIFFSTCFKRPLSSAPPPTMAHAPSNPTRSTMVAIFVASAMWTPARISSLDVPSATREIASDSPKTAQPVANETGFWPLYEVINGELILSQDSIKYLNEDKRKPIEDYLKAQKRFAQIKPEEIEQYKRYIDAQWKEIKNRIENQ